MNYNWMKDLETVFEKNGLCIKNSGGGRWYVLDINTQEYIAECIEFNKTNDNPEEWLKKKCFKRYESQKAYLDKVEEQLIQIKNEVNKWEDRCNRLKEEIN